MCDVRFCAGKTVTTARATNSVEPELRTVCWRWRQYWPVIDNQLRISTEPESTDQRSHTKAILSVRTTALISASKRPVRDRGKRRQPSGSPSKASLCLENGGPSKYVLVLKAAYFVFLIDPKMSIVVVSDTQGMFFSLLNTKLRNPSTLSV